MKRALLGWVFLGGCATVPIVPERPREMVFEGMCDASGAVVLDDGLFAVADDEDNLLRVYDGRRGGPPVRVVNLSDDLGLQKGTKRWPETDIEAATRLGSVALWLTSHGRKRSGKLDESRFRFFATELWDEGRHLRVIGEPYAGLLQDLIEGPSFAAFDFANAAELPPKEPGGLNIEGMTAREDGRSVLVGFRNPVPEGRALIVLLLNPLQVLDGERPVFGEVSLVDLQGLGVRGLSWWRGRYLIIGGSVSGEGLSRLFEWQEGWPAGRAIDLDLTGWNPEGFVTPEDEDSILLLSDDGTTLIEGVECKRLKDPAAKRFRALRVRL